MRIPGTEAHLGYCLNVHPGATPDEMRHAVFGEAPRVRDALAEREGFDGPFGLGLWLSHESALLLSNRAALREFSGRLDDAGLYVFTLNGFPYGAFHGERVKEAVYRPDWSQRERLTHTVRLARILATMLPENVEGSISTVPLTYGEWAAGDPGILRQSVAALEEVAKALAAIENETGRTIRLALEPEPDCFLDDPAHAAAWLNENLFTSTREEALLRKHLGICLDTVHTSVGLHDATAALKTYVDAGIGVYKVQLGAALRMECSDSQAVRQQLSPFADPVYLHQTAVRGEGSPVRYPDLPDALEAAPPGDEWVVHYHVPLAWEGDGQTLSGASGGVGSSFFAEAYNLGVRHFESEIYTLGVFPGAAGRESQILADDLAWILHRFPVQ